jgi:hypothetical protein
MRVDVFEFILKLLILVKWPKQRYVKLRWIAPLSSIMILEALYIM